MRSGVVQCSVGDEAVLGRCSIARRWNVPTLRSADNRGVWNRHIVFITICDSHTAIIPPAACWTRRPIVVSANRIPVNKFRLSPLFVRSC